MQITIPETQTTAHTATAGGYGIPLPPGTYTLEAELPDGRITTRAFTIDDQNIKLDFKASEFAYAEPRVSFTPETAAIVTGNNTLLTWHCQFGETATIDHGIGQVPQDGYITVSPSTSTTYTITTTGPGGTTTVELPITVVEPVSVTLSADQLYLQKGGSSTLTWSSANADTVEIYPFIGMVDANGSQTVEPSLTMTYWITASNSGGTMTKSVTITVATPITVQIISPTMVEIQNAPYALVEGTIENTDGHDTGLIVNAISAMTYGNQFVANHVPIKDGEYNINAIASDTKGNLADDELDIIGEVSEKHVKIGSLRYSGVAPLETQLTVETNFEYTDIDVTFSNPDQVDIIENTSPSTYTVQFTQPGIHYIAADVLDAENNNYSDTIAVVVYDIDEIDMKLRNKFEGMKSLLASGNIDDAIKYFLPESRKRYHDVFTVIGADLANVVSQMEDIQLIHIDDNLAKYRIMKDQMVGGEMRRITYYLFFSKNYLGLWYIDSM